MVKYGNGKIYRIVNINNETIYIGSTCQTLSNRLSTHTHRGNGNKIILIEECPCETKEQLRMREQAVIEEHERLLNMNRAYVYPEQRKGLKLESNRKYYEKNKEKIDQYNQKNKEKISEYKREYREKNKEKISEYNREYNQNNKEKIKKKVVCEYCKCEVGKYYLKKHQESAKCLECQK